MSVSVATSAELAQLQAQVDDLKAKISPPAPSSTISTDGTIISSMADSIIDAALNKWTIGSTGQVVLNGVACPGTASVTNLLYFHGGLYQKNSFGAWYLAGANPASAAVVTWGLITQDPRSPATTPATLPATPSDLPLPARGMTLAFTDPFTSLNPAKWRAALWYNQPQPSAFAFADGVLTMTSPDGNQIDLSTFLGGGAGLKAGKRRFYWRQPFFAEDWTSIWGMGWNHMMNVPKTSDPTTWTIEADGMETDPGNPNNLYSTLHSNTSGAGTANDPKDTFLEHGSGPISILQPYVDSKPILGSWRELGQLYDPVAKLWSIYLDGILVNQINMFASCQQDLAFNLSVNKGGLVSGQSSPGPVQAKFRSPMLYMDP